MTDVPCFNVIASQVGGCAPDVGDGEIIRCLEIMGLKPEEVYFRELAKANVGYALEHGTDIRETFLYEIAAAVFKGLLPIQLLDYLRSASNNYGVPPERFTILTDLSLIGADYTFNPFEKAVLVYRKGPEITQVPPPPAEIEALAGLDCIYAFSEDPKNLLLGVIGKGFPPRARNTITAYTSVANTELRDDSVSCASSVCSRLQVLVGNVVLRFPISI